MSTPVVPDISNHPKSRDDHLVHGEPCVIKDPKNGTMEISNVPFEKNITILRVSSSMELDSGN